MKKILALVLLSAISTTVFADISVNWTSTGFVADSGGGFGTTDRYVQLLWSAANPVGDTAVWGNANNLAAGEYQLYASAVGNWASFATDQDGTASYSNAQVGGANINNGYLFVRIFESSTVTASTHYYQATAVAPVLPTYDPVVPSSVINYDCTGGAQQNATTSMAVVPEPSTVGLLLVGAGLIGLRRFRRS